MKTRKNKKIGFWSDETCEYCGGGIVEKEVDLLRKVKAAYFIFKKVPAGVCHECGVRYYAANTLKIIAERIRSLKPAQRKSKVALLDLAAA